MNFTIKPIMLRAASGSSTVVLNCTTESRVQGFRSTYNLAPGEMAVKKADYAECHN
jgi:hypothetical protein